MLERLGIQKTSLIDFPGKVASVIFTAGCPLCCPYCHNRELISYMPPDSFLPAEEVFDLLRARGDCIRYVVVSGGEPLVHQDLMVLLDTLHNIGLQVKIDTSGVLPHALETVLQHRAVKYVAMDIKTGLHNYYLVGASRDSETAVSQSMNLLRRWKAAGNGDYEFRTVMDPEIVTPEDIKLIGEMILPGETWRHNPLKSG